MSDLSIPSGRVIQAARQMLGAKWRHEGRTRFGVDCIGLVLLSLVLAGWRPRDPRSAYRMVYPRVADADDLQSILATEGERVELAAAQPGDVVVFHYESAKFPQHCGILTKAAPAAPRLQPGTASWTGAGIEALADRRPQVIHASVDMRSVVEAPMGRDAIAAFRIAGVVPGANDQCIGHCAFSPEELAAAELLVLEGSQLWAKR